MRKTLYVLLGGARRLEQKRGDYINEIIAIKLLSSFFDVYYNNELYRDGAVCIGNLEELGPNRSYDYYYIRNNPDVFRRVDGVRLSFAYPYNRDVFSESDYLVVLTTNWKRHLCAAGSPPSRDVLRRLYGEDIADIVPSSLKVIDIGQTLSPSFVNTIPSEPSKFAARCRLTMAQSFGYFGNLSEDLVPWQAFSAVERLATEAGGPEPIIALAGDFRGTFKVPQRNVAYLGSVPYALMPSMVDATSCILANESELNNCLGSRKTLDAIARGKPVLCKRYDTFVEHLGDDYPCYYEDAEGAYQCAKKILHDPDFVAHVEQHLMARRKLFSEEAVRERVRGQLEHYGLL